MLGPIFLTSFFTFFAAQETIYNFAIDSALYLFGAGITDITRPIKWDFTSVLSWFSVWLQTLISFSNFPEILLIIRSI